MSIKKAAIQHQEGREKTQQEELSRKIALIATAVEDLEATLKYNKQLTPQGRTKIELKIKALEKKKQRLETLQQKAQAPQEFLDGKTLKVAGKNNQDRGKSSLVVVSDQVLNPSLPPQKELEGTPQESNLNKGFTPYEQPDSKVLSMSESSEEKEWAKNHKPKSKAKPVSNEQYFQTLVGFCRTHLQIEASEKQFQTEMRTFLNREVVPELKAAPIRDDTHVIFLVLGQGTGKSTSAYFEWAQDGKRHTKTMGIARYLKQTNITDIHK